MEYLECDKCHKRFCRHDIDTMNEWFKVRGIFGFPESEVHLCKKHYKELQKIVYKWLQEKDK